jgi:hypothetical protein
VSIEAGVYQAFIKSVAFIESSQKATPGIELTFLVQVAGQSFERTSTLWLSDGAFPYSKEKLEMLGFNGDFDNPAVDPKYHATETFTVVCRNEPYTDNDGNQKVGEKWEVGRGGVRMGKPAGNDKARAMARLWKSMGGATAPAPAVTPPAAPPAPSAPPPVAPPPPPAAETAEQVEAARTAAWAEYEKHQGDKAAGEWTRMIATMGKPEDQFSVADWNVIAGKADGIPF